MSHRFLNTHKQYFIAFVLFLVAALVWITGFSTNHFYRPDAWDYAQMGKELGDGNGFSTRQVFPRHIPFLDERGHLQEDHWPNLYRYPFVTIIIAFIYFFTQEIVEAAVWQTGIAYLLSIPLLFLLALRFTNLMTALFSTVFYAVNPEVFVGSYNGMTESWSTLLLLMLLLLVLRQHVSNWTCILAGSVCGLSYLTRSQFIILFPITIIYLWFHIPKSRRYIQLVILILGFTLTICPWLIRNYVVAGSPTFSFSNTRNLMDKALPNQIDLEYQIDAPVDTLLILKEHWDAIGAKFLNKIKMTVDLKLWITLFSPDAYLLLILLISLVFRLHSGNEYYASFRDFAFILILCTIFLVCLTVYQNRFFAPILPLMYVIGFYELFHLIGKIRPAGHEWFRFTIYSALIIVIFFRLNDLTEIHETRTSQFQETQSESYEYLLQLPDKNPIVAASTSYLVTVKTGFRSLRLPAFPEDILRIDSDYFHIDYILISPWTFTLFPEYVEFIKSDDFNAKYSFMEKFPDNLTLFAKSK